MAETLVLRESSVVVKVPENLIALRQSWLEGKRAELARAEMALKELKGAGASPRKIERVAERVRLLRKVGSCLEAGYMPMPRFGGEKLTLELEELPLNALIAVNDAVAQELFDEIRFVAGGERTRGYGRRSGQAHRDPMLVGVVRTKIIEAYRSERAGYIPLWSLEEHFLIAWWRPEDTTPEDLW